MPVSRNALASAVHGDIFIVRFSAFEGRRLVARRDAWTPDPALAGRRQMTRRNSKPLTIPSRRVAVILPPVAPPPLALAAFIFPGITGCGARGEHHQCAGE